MRMTKRGEYAIRTLIRLGVAQRMGTPIVSVSRLAESEHIPAKFLENILADLKSAGYVEGLRGKSGGARLICDPEKTKIGELIRFMDGKLAPIGCASETAYEPCTCPDEDHCGLRMLMIDVRNAIANILDRYSLADVVTVTLRKMERDGLVPVIAPVKKTGKTRVAAALPLKPRYADPNDGFLAGLVKDLALNPAER
ncbi:MAG: cymR 1 [Verrucomicrobiales bacterium]|nr:cymR 1 [Verrucomicrobiales bacterium]